MDLSDLTIVILSRGREAVLTNTLRFWSNFNITVLVFHHSENPLCSSELGSNITYVVDKGSYGERCRLVSEFLTTDYAILSSDDELYVPSALAEMKELLIGDSSLASVGGMTIAIGKYGPMSTAVACYTNMRAYTNLGETSFERLSKHFNVHGEYRNGAMYRLMRKDLMIELMQLFSTQSFIATPYIYEVTGEIVVNAFGKSVYLPNVYWIRNWINQPVEHRNWNRKLYFSSWVSDSNYEDQFLRWSQRLSNVGDLTPEEFSMVMEAILKLRKSSEDYEQKRLSRRRIPISDNLKFAVRKFLAPNSLPPRIETTIKSMEEQGARLDRIELLTAIESIT